MPVILVATPGAANANAYCTLAEAETYHESRPAASAWAGTTDVKNRAIVRATELLDEHVDWFGYAAATTQRLCWPRGGMHDRNGNVIDSDEIPQDLKDAAAELAATLLAGDRTADDDIETKRIRSLTAGPVSLTFDAGVAAKVIADSVYFKIQRWGTLRRRTAAVGKVVRV
jgi:hypothetical protein